MLFFSSVMIPFILCPCLKTSQAHSTIYQSFQHPCTTPCTSWAAVVPVQTRLTPLELVPTPPLPASLSLLLIPICHPPHHLKKKLWFHVPSPAPPSLLTQECRGPWPPPGRVRLHLFLKQPCDSGVTNTKDRDLTSSPPIMFVSYLHTA